MFSEELDVRCCAKKGSPSTQSTYVVESMF